MKKQRLIFLLFLLFLAGKSSSQSFLISPLKLEFSGRELVISYDFINKNSSDQFYVWLEITKKNGEPIKATALSGDIGDKINAGTDKKIFWIPENDSIFLNEEVFIEVKAEKYIKSFNKSSAMLMSAAMPGLGQTRVSKGKPWWVGGVVAYGAFAGGLIAHSSSLKTYDEYKTEEDALKRKDLYDKAQRQKNISSGLIVSGAAIWAANIFWMALVPNGYQPLQHVTLSLDQSHVPYKGTTLLTLRLNF